VSIISDRIKAATSALLGISAYQQPPPDSNITLDSEQVEHVRENMGGQLAAPPTSQFRFYLSDLESAHYSADNGDLGPATRLMAGALTDGVYGGIMDTMTGGISKLPRKFYGPSEMIRQLEIGSDSIRSVFDEMIPPAELALIIKDGFELGVGVGELCPVRGRDFPILVRLNPEYLYYRWSENRWYYNSIAGTLPIVPGDGRWVMHNPGGRVSPWRNGKWRSVARAWIPKEHSRLHKDNWEAKLANAARAAIAPAAATDAQVSNWFGKVAAWGVNTVFALRPGWDVKLVEGSGKGWESYDKTADRSDKEFMIIVAGQIGSTEGGAGFANKDLFEVVRIDRIDAVATAAAYTINTQILPQWTVIRYGVDALETPVVMKFDTRRPKDKMASAQALNQAAGATKAWREELALHTVKDAQGKEHTPQLDVAQICEQYDVPVVGDINNDGIPDTDETLQATESEIKATRALRAVK
jgi:hypothetical protein